MPTIRPKYSRAVALVCEKINASNYMIVLNGGEAWQALPAAPAHDGCAPLLIPRHLPSGRWFRGLRGSFCHRSKIIDLYCMSRRPGFSCRGAKGGWGLGWGAAGGSRAWQVRT